MADDRAPGEAETVARALIERDVRFGNPVGLTYGVAHDLRAEVAAEIAEALRQPMRCQQPSDADVIADVAWNGAADFIEERFVSVRPDNEEAKPDA